MKNDPLTSHKHVAASARRLAMGTMASRLSGFTRDLLVAAFFDRRTTDCFVVAFRLPNLFRRILGEGALSATLLPLLIGTYDQGQPTVRSRRLINGIWTVLFVVLLSLTLAGTLWMPQMMTLLVGGTGFQSVPGKFDLVVSMARWIFPFVALISIYAFGATLLQSRHHFCVSAFAPALFNLTLITVIFTTHASSHNNTWLSAGVLLGGAIQAGALWPQLRRLKLIPHFQIPTQDHDVNRFFKNFTPTLIGTGTLQLIGVLNVYFASWLPEGSHSYLYWVDRLLEMPMALIGVSLSSALLPTLSHAHHQKDGSAMSDLLRRNLQVALFWVVPFAVGMWWMSRPTIELVYMRGQFTAIDAARTASLLKIAALTLISGTLLRTISALFYATDRAQTAAVLACLTLFVHATIAFCTYQRFGLIGLAWASAVSTTFHFVSALCCIHYLIIPIQWRRLAAFLVRLSFATLVMAFFACHFDWLEQHLSQTDFLYLIALNDKRPLLFLAYFMTAGAGFLAYAGFCQLLGISEFAMIKVWRNDRKDVMEGELP